MAVKNRSTDIPKVKLMSLLRAWPLTRLLLICFAWVLVSSVLLLWPLISAIQLALASAEQSDVGAISFPILWLLVRLAIVIVPPIVLLSLWLAARAK